MSHTQLKATCLAIMAIMSILLAPGQTRGDTIDFTDTRILPDLTVGTLHVNYDSVSSLFRAGSFSNASDPTTLRAVTMMINVDGVGSPSDIRLTASYLIDVPLDSSGTPTGPGTLTIFGTKANFTNTGALIPSSIVSNQLLLSAELVSFGFGDSGSNQFSFLWNNTGGVLVNEGVFGDLIGTTLTAGTYESGFEFVDFSQSFRTTGNGQSTNDSHGVVPSPVALPAGILLFGIAAYGRRRRRA